MWEIRRDRRFGRIGFTEDANYRLPLVHPADYRSLNRKQNVFVRVRIQIVPQAFLVVVLPNNYYQLVFCNPVQLLPPAYK